MVGFIDCGFIRWIVIGFWGWVGFIDCGYIHWIVMEIIGFGGRGRGLGVGVFWVCWKEWNIDSGQLIYLYLYTQSLIPRHHACMRACMHAHLLLLALLRGPSQLLLQGRQLPVHLFSLLVLFSSR